MLNYACMYHSPLIFPTVFPSHGGILRSFPTPAYPMQKYAVGVSVNIPLTTEGNSLSHVRAFSNTELKLSFFTVKD
jgi:hypothetical protein